jgi:hypothetical protein
MEDTQKYVQEELFKQHGMNLDKFHSLLNFMLGLFGFIIALFSFTINTVSGSIFSNPNNWLLWSFIGFMLVAFLIVIHNLEGLDAFDRLMKSSNGDFIVFKTGALLQKSNFKLYSALGKQKSVYRFAVIGITLSLFYLFIYFAYFKTVLEPSYGVIGVLVFILFLLYSIVITLL